MTVEIDASLMKHHTAATRGHTTVWAIVVVALAVVAGLLAVAEKTAPTGHVPVDTMLVGVGVGVITLIGARARWWALALSAVAAAVIAEDPVLVAVAAGAAVVPVVLRVFRREWPVVAALSAGATLNVLIRADRNDFQGFGALVAAGCVFLLFFTGVPRLPTRWRRLAWIGSAAIVAFVIAAGLGFGYAVGQARQDLVDGVRAAELGVDALEQENFADAADFFEQSASLLDAANTALDQPWTRPAALVPVLAQHREAVVDLSAVGASGAVTVSEALGLIDLEQLTVADSRVDVAALAAMQQPLRDVRDALADLQAAADSARSPWLVAGARQKLDEFDENLTEHVPSLDAAVEAVNLAPAMLGADEPRHYLLLFTTPSEARGLGGFIGSYAVLTADNGLLTLSAGGSAADLDELVAAAGIRVAAAEEFIARYGRFGYDHPGGLAGDAAFRNLAMTPNFPWVGEIAASFYEQTTGDRIDGVIAADPYVIAEVLRLTGPVTIEQYDQELTADNAVTYLLHDQYVFGEGDSATRHDSLTDAADAAFAAMMRGGLPDPFALAQQFGPLVKEGRLLFWSAREDEQALLGRQGMNGAMPSLDGADGWAFTVSNVGGNKVDYFLERRAAYEATTDATGTTHGTITIELTNTAPAEGEPDYVIGGGVVPDGTNRTYLSVYSALGLDRMTVDGERVDVDAGTEMGWNVYSRFIDIPPGATVTVEVELSRILEHPDVVVTWVQPLASPISPVE